MTKDETDLLEALATRKGGVFGGTEVMVLEDRTTVWFYNVEVATYYHESGILAMFSCPYVTRIYLRQLDLVCQAYGLESPWQIKRGSYHFYGQPVDNEQKVTVHVVHDRVSRGRLSVS